MWPRSSRVMDYDPSMRFLVFLIFTLIANAAAATASNNGWVLEQTRALNGKGMVFTSDKGRRFASADAGYALVSAPPDWNVYLYNDKKRIYFPLLAGKKLKVSSMSLGLLHGYILPNANDLKWKKTRSTKFMGHPVDIWRGSYDGSKIGTNGKSGAAFAYSVDFWVATDVSLAPQIAKAYHVLQGWPDNVYYLPLRCVKVESSVKQQMLLETTSFKPAYNPPDMFQVPKGYKLAHNEMDVFMNMDNMTDLLDGLGEKHKNASAGKAAN
jgi:hypothetical protein